MKKTLLTLMGFLSYLSINAQKNCNEAFNAANYSVSHTAKAYDAYNMTHTQEWAYRAIETFREVEKITSKCGCSETSDFAHEGYEAVKKAQYQNTWERSRFYAKKANEKAKLMMDAFTECTNTDISKIKNSNSDNKYASVQRSNEIQEQLKIKKNAEAALIEINKAYQNLANALGCKQAYTMAKSSYEYSLSQINNNTLSETKLHYTLQLNRIAEKGIILNKKYRHSLIVLFV